MNVFNYVSSILKFNNKDTKTQSTEPVLMSLLLTYMFRGTFSKLTCYVFYNFEHVFMRYYNQSKHCKVYFEDFKAKNPNSIGAIHIVRTQNFPKN